MNNSQRLDYIIEQLKEQSKKLDKHDIYFQEIRTDIVEMKSDILRLDKDVKNLSKQVKDLNDYRKRNNNSIEIEVTKSVCQILKKDEKSLYIIDVSTIFPKKYKN